LIHEVRVYRVPESILDKPPRAINLELRPYEIVGEPSELD